MATDHQPSGETAPIPLRDRSWHRKRGHLPVISLLALAWLVAACTQASSAAAPGAPATVAGCPAGHPATVPLQILHGPSGATLALAPVMVKGKGPFPFPWTPGPPSR